MSDHYSFAAYWFDRPEPIPECARRLEQMFDDLARCHPLLATWYRKAYTKRAALQRRITLTRDALEQLFEPETAEHAGEGHFFSAWNGKDDDEVLDLSIFAGGTSLSPNSVVITLPNPAADNSSLFDIDVLICMCRAVVTAWEPDCARLTEYYFNERHAPRNPDDPTQRPKVGWLTYLSAHRLGKLPPGAPCERIPIPQHGDIFVLTPEPVRADSDEHAARYQALFAFLRDHDALGAMPGSERPS